jgi:lipopolysaccharide biosynthesis regulator YciM
MSDEHLSVDEAIKAMPKTETTAFLEAQAHLAFGNSAKAIEILKAYFDQNPDALKKVEPQFSALSNSINTATTQPQDLLSQFRPIQEALAVNGCGECTIPSGRGYWIYSAIQKKWICVSC